MPADLLNELEAGAAVHLWLRRLDLDTPVSDDDLAVLDADERQRGAAVRFPADRRRFVLRHRHLREVLGGYLAMTPAQVPLDTRVHRPPSLPSMPSLRISLSSSADRAIVAVAWNRPVGIDIERMDPAVEIDAVAETVFSRPERVWLGTVPISERRTAFFRLWARKEAFVKALGTGFGRDLKTFDAMAARIADREADVGAPSWYVRDIAAAADFACACCAVGENWPIVFKPDDP